MVFSMNVLLAYNGMFVFENNVKVFKSFHTLINCKKHKMHVSRCSLVAWLGERLIALGVSVVD